MSDTITVTGLVATTPRHLVTSEGLPITSFRVASTQRRFDRAQERWIDAETNWYTISSFRQLAINSAGSVVKGDRVLVTGRLKIREWENGERAGTTIEIEADALGHDLTWGTTAFSRTISSASDSASASAKSVAQSAGESGATAGESDLDGVAPEERTAQSVEPELVEVASAAVPF